MAKILGLIATFVAVGALGACGGGGDSAAESPSPVVNPTVVASPSPASAVEAYCQQVDDYAEKASELAASPSAEGADELKAKAEELQQTASELTQELMDDPDQATKVQECTTTLQEALAG